MSAKNYYEQSLLWGGLPRDKVLLTVSAVTERHAKPLKALFSKHTGDEMGVHFSNKRMNLDQLLAFARAFQLCPGLLPRIEVLQLFQCSLTTKCEAAPELKHEWSYNMKGRMARQKGSFGGLTYNDFLLWMAATAGVVFSGAEWDEQYPELQHKFQLLLFWMDQGSLIFRGNGNDLLNHMQLSVEQFQAAVRLSEPFSRPIDAVEGGAIGYDVITSLPDNSTLLREIPSVQGLEEEFQSTYNYYCTYGDRLNVGPHALLKRSQFHRLMKNMKMLDLHTLRPSDVDVILERRLGKGVTKMDFDAFVFVFVAASARRIPTMPWLMGFYFTVLWKLLPSSERLAQMHSSGGLANGGMIIDTDYWLEREIRVKELRKVLIEPDVMYLFNVVKEQLEENSAYLSKLDEQSWKLFLDDEAVQAGESGAGRSGEPVPMPPSSAMGSAAFMSSPSARMALNMEFHGGLTPTPQESTAADPAADDGEEKAADVGRMLSGLSVNGHKLTRDSPSSYLTTASMGARQQASRSPDSWPVRALIDQHLRKQSKAPSPAGKKQAATKPPAPPSPQVERASSPPTFTDSMKHVMRERDEARKEAEKLRSVIENMEARRKIEERQQYEQEEAHETFMAWQRGGVGPGSPQVAARPLSMDSWQAQLRENEGSFGGNSAHFAAGAAGDSDDDGGKPSLDTEPARHADREASSSYYPYPSVASPRGGEPTSPSRGFASAAYRLYEAADSSQSGRLTTGQLIAALQEQPELAEALGFPEDTKWDFVVGYCYSESGDISLAEFIDKLPVLRGAAQYEAALSEQSKSPMRASGVMSPERKVGSRPYYYSSAASQRTSAERLSQPRSSPAMMTTASTRRHASPSPSPRWSARSAARKHRTATASPYMSPQMSSSTRRKREPDFSYRSRSDEFWAVQRREEQRTVAGSKGSRMESRSPPKMRGPQITSTRNIQLMTTMAPSIGY